MTKVLWAAVAVAAVAWSSLHCRRSHPAANEVGDNPVAAAVAKLPWASHLVTESHDGDLRAGVYLSERPMDAAAVRTLPVGRPDDPGWKSVLRITADPPAHDMGEFAYWDQEARIVGGLLLIGDPDLVRRAADELAR
jgi:hypothetical protein